MLAHAFKGVTGSALKLLLALFAQLYALKKTTQNQNAKKHEQMRKWRSKAPKRLPKWSQKWSQDVIFSTFANPCFRATLQWFWLIFMVSGYPGGARKR